ncbi:MAG: polyprenyl synthetase family protein [Deltaproteobacteria bacterium]|nr:polyprenyl synthetase family protein [Deltaproteobacteria bacterium]
MTNIQAELKALRQQVDDALAAAVPGASDVPESLAGALRHGALGAGKRLRPLLALGAAEAIGEVPLRVMKTACAVELVHTSSLVLDDLPCMDAHEERRGMPAVHRVFGESTAILSAVALLARAFELVAQNASELSCSRQAAAWAVEELARCVGASGMCAGQQLDLVARSDTAPPASIEEVHLRKTGVLFEAAVAVPALLLSAEPSRLLALRSYASCLGQAFQLCDDIADLQEDAQGTVGAGKGFNLALAVGRAPARARVAALLDRARADLACFDRRNRILGAIVDLVKAP